MRGILVSLSAEFETSWRCLFSAAFQDDVSCAFLNLGYEFVAVASLSSCPVNLSVEASFSFRPDFRSCNVLCVWIFVC